MSRRSGLTILEILVASTLLGLLSAGLLAVFLSGSKAMLQGTVQANLVQQTNVACQRFSREVERSIYESGSANGPACSVLSAVDGSGTFVYDAGSNIPRWQCFLIFYHDTAKQQLRLRRLSVVGTPTESAPVSIELFGGLPLASYASSGRVLAENIYACDFRILPQRQALMSVGAEGQRPGRPLERFVQRMLVNFRN